MSPLESQSIFNRFKTPSKVALVLAVTFSIIGCSSGCTMARYLAQATRGQMKLMNTGRPIEKVIQDKKVPIRIRELLKEVPEIKKFGEKWGIKPTSNYKEYVKVEGSAVVYVVSAAQPLEFKSKEWSFPIVGRFPYLGWFDREGAKEFAETLKKENLDVDVRGARAFSTLGWFSDPILSSMISNADEAYGDLVNVVIHEGTHATYYLNGQSHFNESLASFVADQLTPEFIRARKGENSTELKSYLEGEKRGERYRKRLHEAYLQLKALYESSESDENKLKQKEKILSTLRSELEWKRDLNNATLIQYKTYDTLDEFQKLFDHCQKDWQRFWRAIHKINESSFQSSQQENLPPVFKGVLSTNCD